ncbi:MAG: hypothetical protein IPM41_15635 [Sphingomonadales bacterium]|nr:hypothetical protein [Sphingomonadales bacterium]
MSQNAPLLVDLLNGQEGSKPLLQALVLVAAGLGIIQAQLERFSNGRQ